jgi:hypothetical protein
MTAIEYLKAKPVGGSVVVGLLASLCCGGSLIFASIGLGVFYLALGLSRFIPQALAAGALSIVAINYLYYRQMVKKGERWACGHGWQFRFYGMVKPCSRSWRSLSCPS